MKQYKNKRNDINLMLLMVDSIVASVFVVILVEFETSRFVQLMALMIACTEDRRL